MLATAGPMGPISSPASSPLLKTSASVLARAAGAVSSDVAMPTASAMNVRDFWAKTCVNIVPSFHSEQNPKFEIPKKLEIRRLENQDGQAVSSLFVPSNFAF